MHGLWPLSQPLVWVAFAGAAGGMVNAIVSHNLFLWPFRVSPVKVVMPGLVVNVAVGAMGAVGGVLAFCGGASHPPLTAGDLALSLAGSLLVGGLAARWVTNEADVRLLRAAATRACAAPAAHPDTARAMEIASPYEVFQTATDLVPRFRSSL